MFYDRFRQLCESKGVSCNKAALEIGLSNATPTKWRKTGATPTGETLDRIAKYFGVTTDYLLTGLYRGSVTSYSNGICAYTGSSMQEIEGRLAEKDSSSYVIVFRGPGVIITVDTGRYPTDAQIRSVIDMYNPSHAKKAPTISGERDILDEIDIAFYGEYKELTEDDKETVRDMVRVMRERRAKKQEQ
jgi:transcriptional regulator with XRE-family HTH domain